jgi:predicted acylesterase/phospholipase RssA
MTTATKPKPKMPFIDTWSWINATSKQKQASLQSIIEYIESSEIQKVNNRRNDTSPVKIDGAEDSSSTSHSSQRTVTTRDISSHSMKSITSSLSTSKSAIPTEKPKSTTLSLSTSKSAIPTEKLKSKLSSLLKGRNTLKATNKKDSLHCEKISSQGGRVASRMTIPENTNPTILTEKFVDDDSLTTTNHNSSTISSTEQILPINIFCMDGGGSKGYAIQAMSEVLEEMCSESDSIHCDGDFLSRFDLVGGTSVGGIAALIYSQNENTIGHIQATRKYLDHSVKNVFTRLSYLRLLMTGSAAKDTNDIRAASRHFYGEKWLSDVPDNGIRCFAVSACRNEEGTGIDPFLLRTYEHPLDDRGHDDHEHVENKTSDDRNKRHHFAGTSDVKLWEATAATSAAPGAFDRVRVNINGKHKSLADGGIVSNCPVAIALKEAQSIWPDRPIGVVLSFGLDSKENDLNQDAIDAVRLNNPGLHYQRIFMPEIEDYDFLETDPKKLLEIERKVKNHMHTPLVRARLALMLDLLFDSPSRRSRQKEEVSNNKDDSESDGDTINEHDDNKNIGDNTRRSFASLCCGSLNINKWKVFATDDTR